MEGLATVRGDTIGLFIVKILVYQTIKHTYTEFPKRRKEHRISIFYTDTNRQLLGLGFKQAVVIGGKYERLRHCHSWMNVFVGLSTE